MPGGQDDGSWLPDFHDALKPPWIPDFRQALTPEWIPNFRQILGEAGRAPADRTFNRTSGVLSGSPIPRRHRVLAGSPDRTFDRTSGALSGCPAASADGMPDFHALLGGAGGSYTSDESMAAMNTRQADPTSKDDDRRNVVLDLAGDEGSVADLSTSLDKPKKEVEKFDRPFPVNGFAATFGQLYKSDGRAGRDADGDGLVNERERPAAAALRTGPPPSAQSSRRDGRPNCSRRRRYQRRRCGVAAAAAAVASSLMRSPNSGVRAAGLRHRRPRGATAAATAGFLGTTAATTSPTSAGWSRPEPSTASPRRRAASGSSARSSRGPQGSARRAGQLRPAARRQADRGGEAAGLQDGAALRRGDPGGVPGRNAVHGRRSGAAPVRVSTATKPVEIPSCQRSRPASSRAA